MNQPYSTLADLLSSYFHENWMRDAASADDILALMIRDAPAHQLRAGLAELDLLIGSGLCEPQLRDLVLYELDCHFAPETAGVDISVWLLQLRDRLRRAVWT